MSEVILIRPGSTDFDVQNRIQGSLNLPLNEQGVGEVEKIASQMHQHSIEMILTSPCDSARATAEFISASLDVPVKEKQGLANLNQGLWQGLQVEEVRRKYPKVYKQWLEHPSLVCPPEGETVDSAIERIKKALQKPLKKKISFAIVTPDPLASLVSAVIRQQQPDLSQLYRGLKSTLLQVEVLEKDGQIIQNALNCNTSDSSSGKLKSETSQGRTAAERIVQ